MREASSSTRRPSALGQRRFFSIWGPSFPHAPFPSDKTSRTRRGRASAPAWREPTEQEPKRTQREPCHVFSKRRGRKGKIQNAERTPIFSFSIKLFSFFKKNFPFFKNFFGKGKKLCLFCIHPGRETPAHEDEGNSVLSFPRLSFSFRHTVDRHPFFSGKRREAAGC